VLVVRYVMLCRVTVSEPRRASKIGWHRQERLLVSSDEYVLDASTGMMIKLEETNGEL
jgi:hypothetical protein